jgi:2-iminobutanoate/2-iminopropanoate deaminase
MKEIVATKKAPEAIGPYSQAVKIKASELLFCSGQIPLDPATGEITGVSAAEQAQRVMDNLKAVIEAAGYTMADVVKTTIYLTDLKAFQEVNKVYETFFFRCLSCEGNCSGISPTPRSPRGDRCASMQIN